MREKLRPAIAYDEPDERGRVVARVDVVPGALSQGKTQEARENVIDALRLMLAPDDDDPDVAVAASSSS